MCNIHNAFFGICNTSLLGSKNVGIVAEGTYNIVLLEKEYLGQFSGKQRNCNMTKKASHKVENQDCSKTYCKS